MRHRFRVYSFLKYAITLGLIVIASKVCAEATYVQTPYAEPKVVFDFYFDEPEKTASALYWVRALLNPLLEEPYGYAPEFMEIKIVIHGTEIVTLAKRNYDKYKDIVDRMQYYASLGVEFKVCAMAAQDYGYQLKDFQDFVQVIPSAITELAHWQLQGFALIQPGIMTKKYAIEELQ